jgi:hypothetical protein
MPTTLDTTNLTVTISEQLTSNGQTLNFSNQLVLPNIKPFDPRVMTIPITEITVMQFGATPAAGQFISANVRYIRITNKDDTNFIRIRVIKSGGQTFDVKLEAGKSFIMGNTKESANTTGAAFSAFVDMDNISAQSDTSPCDIEYFVASIAS